MKALLRYPGSKWSLAKKIVDLLPEHKSYLEPFFGSGAVLFTKPLSPIETVNDLNDDIVNLFQIIQKEPEALQEKVFLTPYARTVYNSACEETPENEVDKAASFMVRSVMSHGFRVCERSGWKFDIDGRESSYAVKHWNDLPALIQEAALRLKKVQIECRPALDLIQRFNRSDVCMYLDPPYVLSTRSRKQYTVEMSDDEHVQLLELLNQSKARILLSGYDSDLYRRYLSDWEKLEFPATAEQGLRRTEVIWTNFKPQRQLDLSEVGV